MNPFGHWPALLLILVVVLIVWGPGKLPEIGSAVGRALHEFRKTSNEFQDEFRRSTTVTRSEPETYQTTDPAAAPVAAAPAPAPEPAKPITPAPDVTPSAKPDVKS